MSKPLPLAGLRVLSFDQYGAGPYCTMIMAEMGADVIKIENPGTGGDFSRATGPYFLGEHDSLFFQSLNLNKRSLTLDLKSPKGREVLHKLVATSDCLVGNMRGNQPAKLGLDYDALKAINPKIVCGHISAYGRETSRADWPGYDFLMQAEAGFMSMSGEPDGPPVRLGVSMVDFMTGTMMAYAVTAAVLACKTNDAPGRDVDLSLMDLALHQLTYAGSWYLNEGLVSKQVPRGAHASVTPSQLQKTKDGWLFVMAQNPKFWDILLAGIGRADLDTDPRFIDMPSRLANRDALTKILDDSFSARTTDEWINVFKGQLPVGPVYNIDRALDNPFLQETQMVQTVPHPDRPNMRALANPVLLDGERLKSRFAPKLGQDTEAVLREAGYRAADIDALRAAKAI
ncbi:MAG: CoA transferase [Alphaproteobacteria bacterium]|nr:CoA transferase [Alphaproteobacteria bacterium]PHY00683.1 MAG: CoA transferase [Rhodospirillaceae bacterium]